MPKVIVVATSRKTRGGITSVIKAHETGEHWKKYHCKWIETHRDGNNIRKLWYLITALIQYILILPFYDIVHIHIATTKSAHRKKIFFYLAKLLRKKTIFHFHPSNEKFLYNINNQKLYRKLFSKADIVLVLSEQWKRWIYETLSLSEKIEVLYNPCPEVCRREDIRKKQILFAGSIIQRKGYETLIRAFGKIAYKYPEWKVVFAGNGEIENGKKIAIELGISQQITFLGWVNGVEKEKVFQESMIYCLASDGEGFPMGVLDAWAYGIPCIMTPVGGLPDIIVDYKNGILFQVGDINDLSNKLKELIENQELRKSIVTHSDKYVYETFEVQYINTRLENFYQQIIK